MFEIIFSIVCVVAAIALTALIVTNNQEFDGKTAPGWWIVSILISQLFVVATLAVWWKEWFIDHRWIMNLSSSIAAAGFIIYVVVKIKTRR